MELNNQKREPIPLCMAHANEIFSALNKLLQLSESSDALLDVFWDPRYLSLYTGVVKDECDCCLNRGNAKTGYNRAPQK